jgi:putative transposase
MSSLHPENKDVMTLTPISAKVKSKRKYVRKSATAESLAKSNRTISKDKFSLCGRSTLKPKSLPTSVAASTGKEKGLFPYWNARCQANSLKLWLPTEIAWRDSDTNLSGGFLQSKAENSWFSMKVLPNPQTQNSQKIFVPLFTSSLAGSTVAALTKSKKIRVYPTAEQKVIFKKWFGYSRWCFNRALNLLNSGLQNKLTTKKLVLKNLPEYFKEAPYAVKGNAAIDCALAVTAAISKYRKTKQFQRVKHRLKRDNTQSCFIPKTALSAKGIYPSLSEDGLLFSENLPKEYGDSRLVFENDCWYICVSTKVKNDNSQAENQGRVVALDPGIRTFQTFFSEHSVGKIGSEAFSRIQRLSQHLDKLISKKKLARTGRDRLQKAITRMFVRIRNLVDELHWKTCLFLVNNFDIILLPTFETSQMVKKNGKRRLRVKSVRNMLTFAFYRFSQRLKQKAKEYGKVVISVCEAYTSKTASWTGELKRNIGGAKTISSAGKKVDRDVNGARGIFLRALVDHPEISLKSLQSK